MLSQRHALGLLFLALALVFVFIAYSSGRAGFWVIAAAGGGAGAWMLTMSVSSCADARKGWRNLG